jgi:hypothetical protein
MDDLPRPANPTIDLGGIPASQDTFRSIRQFSVIDKVECQERYISMTLNLGIDHVVPWIRERRLHFLHWRKPQLHRVRWDYFWLPRDPGTIPGSVDWSTAKKVAN